MNQTLEEIADRIVICGLHEMQTPLQTGEIGAVVTTCTSNELKRFNHPDIEKRTNGIRKDNPKKYSGLDIVDLISSLEIQHHESLLYEHLYGYANDALKMQQGDFDMLSKQELDNKMQAFFREQTQNTIDFIDDFFERHTDQKIMIHCAEGSDRSASIVAIYLMRKHGVSIDDALTQIQRVRPGAQLDIPTEVFKSFLGDQYDSFDEALKLYKRTIQSNSVIKYMGSTGKFTCLKDYFDDKASQVDEQNGFLKYVSHLSNCNRFGIKPPTWRL